MILVAGASASGKTHLLRRLAERMPRLTIISGSGLLREAERPLNELTEEQALTNQDVIATQLRLRECVSDDMILDGHAVIKTINGMIAVPDSWFDAVNIGGLVHVEAVPGDIVSRRHAQRQHLTLEQAEGEQAAERDALRRQAARLSVPLFELPPGDLEALAVWFDRLRRLSGGVADD